ncbi:Fic family protein [Halovulum sp. GXIMD14793]
MSVLMVVRTKPSNEGTTMLNSTDKIIKHKTGLLNLTENHIRQLHQVLLRHSTKDERHRGEYKKLDNHVVAMDADGKEIGVVFEIATPFETPRLMEELVHWVRKATEEEALHPLLIVAVFAVQFLAIHPFQDGNGRLSRILTTLMLLRAGYAYVPYASLESVIEENKDIYYKSLRRTQTTLKGNDPDWLARRGRNWSIYLVGRKSFQTTNLAITWAAVSSSTSRLLMQTVSVGRGTRSRPRWEWRWHANGGGVTRACSRRFFGNSAKFILAIFWSISRIV